MRHLPVDERRPRLNARVPDLFAAWWRAIEAAEPDPARRQRRTAAARRPARRMAGAARTAAAVLALVLAVAAGWLVDPLDMALALSSRAADTLGWAAAALTVATFSCRDPLHMRPLAVCTNLVFVGYALFAGLAPVLALHGLLLPINLLRWRQSVRGANPPRSGVMPVLPTSLR